MGRTVTGLKGNPASKRMENQSKKDKRIRNANKNATLKAQGLHPKQLRNAANLARHEANKQRRES